MWSTSLASFKENLNKIAQDDYDNSSIYNSNDSPHRFSDRSFSYSNSNGFDSAHDSEIDQYIAQIRKLQDSEAEIKALSVNYAALLKEKEDLALLEERNRQLEAKQSTQVSKITQLSMELDKECRKLVDINLKFQDEQTMDLSIQEELRTLKADKDKMYVEMSHIRNDLNHKNIRNRATTNGVE